MVSNIELNKIAVIKIRGAPGKADSSDGDIRINIRENIDAGARVIMVVIKPPISGIDSIVKIHLCLGLLLFSTELEVLLSINFFLMKWLVFPRHYPNPFYLTN